MQFKRVHFPTESAGSTIVACDQYGRNAYCLFSSGNLYTWGINNNGQLGLGNTTQYQFPTLSATGVSAVYGTYGNTGQYGYDQTRLYILKTDGFIYGCGGNGNGQLGVGNTTNPITSWTKITTFSSGQVSYVWNMGADNGATYFILSDNSIYGCGYNGYGVLGNGTTTSLSTPTNLTTYLNPSKYGVTKMTGDWGNYQTLYYLLSNGSAYALGFNGNGQVGQGNTTTPVTSPHLVTTVAANIWSTGQGSGSPAMFYNISNNTTNLYSFGYNNQGQLGNGNTTAVSTPTVVHTSFSNLMNEGILDPSG